jgi:hypothetical protein
VIWPISRPERRHLSEARLLEVALSIATEAEREASHAHIRSCARCASRLAELSAFADNLSAAATADFDDVFTPEHLAGERERIIRRIERLVGCQQSARVLMFPVASHPARPTPARLRHWLAVAAAAGLLAGVTLGQFVRLKPPSEPRAGVPEAIPPINPAPVSPLVLSDADVLPGDQEEEEAFLEELELSLISLRVSELRVFDELTPQVRDVAADVW